MRKLLVFDSVSLDGYFTDAKGDMSWAHKNDPEWVSFSSDSAKGESVLLFGRVTYEMMVAYWPTPAAAKDLPAVAQGMNASPKIVFSRTLDKVTWQNTKLVTGSPVEEVRRLKSESGPDLVVLGSGTIVSQLTAAGVVDEYELVVVPVVLGQGRSLFEGVKAHVNLKRTKCKTFTNGNVVLWYEPTR
jgi:dihydrofolate reductase